MNKTHAKQQGHGYNHHLGLVHHQPQIVDLVIIQGIRVYHEFDDYGAHRIKIDKRYSDWTGYQGIAQLHFPSSGGTIAATTDYYQGVLPNVFMYFK